MSFTVYTPCMLKGKWQCKVDDRSLQAREFHVKDEKVSLNHGGRRIGVKLEFQLADIVKITEETDTDGTFTTVYIDKGLDKDDKPDKPTLKLLHNAVADVIATMSPSAGRKNCMLSDGQTPPSSPARIRKHSVKEEILKFFSGTKLFGGLLPAHMKTGVGETEEVAPAVLKACIEYLEAEGTNRLDASARGIYRKPGNKARYGNLQKRMEDNWLSGIPLSADIIEEDKDITARDVASVITAYLREVKPSLIPDAIFQMLKLVADKYPVSENGHVNSLATTSAQEVFKDLQEYLEKLARDKPYLYATMKFVFRHLKKVTNHADDNEVHAAALTGSIILSLYNYPVGEADIEQVKKIGGAGLGLLVEHVDAVFGLDVEGAPDEVDEEERPPDKQKVRIVVDEDHKSAEHIDSLSSGYATDTQETEPPSVKLVDDKEWHPRAVLSTKGNGPTSPVKLARGSPAPKRPDPPSPPYKITRGQIITKRPGKQRWANKPCSDSSENESEDEPGDGSSTLMDDMPGTGWKPGRRYAIKKPGPTNGGGNMDAPAEGGEEDGSNAGNGGQSPIGSKEEPEMKIVLTGDNPDAGRADGLSPLLADGGHKSLVKRNSSSSGSTSPGGTRGRALRRNSSNVSTSSRKSNP